MSVGIGGASLVAGTMLGTTAWARENSGSYPALGYAQLDFGQPLQRHAFQRRALSADDVLIDIKFCGVCHTDVHFVKGDFGRLNYPLMAGHEIAGHVAAIGNAVTKFKVGDPVGVGCMINSCGACEFCSAGQEQYCTKGNIQTYGTDRDGNNNLGGYSNQIVVREAFTIRIPDSMDLARAAPLLCAGVTTFSPMESWKIEAGDSVGIVGLGGLGHVATKLAIARGAKVTVFTSSESKREDAIAMGATDVVIWPDEEAFAHRASSLNSIIATVPVPFDINPFIGLLKTNGVISNVGLLGPYSAPVNNVALMPGQKILTSSVIGGIAQTQQMIDYCAKQNILADIELISPDEIYAAMDRIVDKSVRYRFVIDMARSAV
nr:NAD(P)-dependent alcohol dehydrogenase [uncultured Devosia sp.]